MRTALMSNPAPAPFLMRAPASTKKETLARAQSDARAIALAIFAVNTMNESDRLAHMEATAVNRQQRRAAAREIAKFTGQGRRRGGKRGLTVPVRDPAPRKAGNYFDHLPDGRTRCTSQRATAWREALALERSAVVETEAEKRARILSKYGASAPAGVLTR